jgi:hypothetical protein
MIRMEDLAVIDRPQLVGTGKQLAHHRWVEEMAHKHKQAAE